MHTIQSANGIVDPDLIYAGNVVLRDECEVIELTQCSRFSIAFFGGKA